MKIECSACGNSFNFDARILEIQLDGRHHKNWGHISKEIITQCQTKTLSSWSKDFCAYPNVEISEIDLGACFSLLRQNRSDRTNSLSYLVG